MKGNFTEDGSVVSRRHWLKRVAAMPGIAVMLNRKPRVTIPYFRVSPRARTLLDRYPQPKWLPEGFWIAEVASPSAFCFGTTDANNQLAFITRAKVIKKRSIWQDSMFICVAPASSGGSLRGCEGNDGVPLTLTRPDGQVTVGRLYDGSNVSLNGKLTWDRSFGHAVVLESSGYRIGVFAYKAGGKDRSTLERVALSVG